MLEILSYQFVWLAIICSLILAGIHAYLGFHIVSRGVIFVDLSLAQVAALGAVVAPMIGVHEGGVGHYLVALLFTFVGAWIISVARTEDESVPQEAFIGILYAGAAAATILALAGQPGGMEELQHMLAGSLLTVTPNELVTLAILFAVIGIIHFVFRDRFFYLTSNRNDAVAKGWKVTWWDFLFYATFGVVVTSAVRIAGVFLVFSLLVIPPVIALLISKRSSHRLTLGWIVAFIASVGGIFASVGLDLPTGPSIIAVLVLILLVVAMANQLRKA
jgi:zinc/manganese transport system permease protein